MQAQSGLKKIYEEYHFVIFLSYFCPRFEKLSTSQATSFYDCDSINC